MIINFSKNDLMQGQPFTPNWYKGVILKDEIKTDKGRIDYVLTLGFDDAQLKSDERTLTCPFYNAIDKGKGFLVPLMASLLRKSIKEITESMEAGIALAFEIGDGINTGKQVQFYVDNEMFEGRPISKVKSFLPYDAQPPV